MLLFFFAAKWFSVMARGAHGTRCAVLTHTYYNVLFFRAYFSEFLAYLCFF